MKAFELKRNDLECCKLVLYMNARQNKLQLLYSKHPENNVSHTLNLQNEIFLNVQLKVSMLYLLVAMVGMSFSENFVEKCMHQCTNCDGTGILNKQYSKLYAYKIQNRINSKCTTVYCTNIKKNTMTLKEYLLWISSFLTFLAKQFKEKYLNTYLFVFFLKKQIKHLYVIFVRFNFTDKFLSVIENRKTFTMC